MKILNSILDCFHIKKLRISFLLIIYISISFTNASAEINRVGLQLWLCADSGLVLQNGFVTSWNDLSGNGNNATTLSEIKPKQVFIHKNGLPSVEFDGKNTGMQTNAFKTFPNKRGTFFIVMKVNGAGMQSGVGAGTLLSTYYGSGITWQFTAKEDVYGYYDGVGGEGFPFSATRLNKWDVVCFTRTNDTLMNIYRLGENKYYFNITNNQPSINPLKIGFNGRLETFNGNISEILFYDNALSDAEIKKVNDYLMEKYDIEPMPKEFTKTYPFYIIIAFVVGLIAYAFEKARQNFALKKSLKQLEQARQIDLERFRISREMHDDIGAGLTQITLMSEALKSVNNSSEANAIANTSRNLVSSMNEIIWSLNAEYKTVQDLYSYMREQLYQLLEYSNIKFAIDLETDNEQFVLSNQQRRNILLSVKEVVNNAVKHSKATQITISANFTNKLLYIVVNDDGKGFDNDKKHNGNGLKNIVRRAEEINGTVNVESVLQHGTTYVFSFYF